MARNYRTNAKPRRRQIWAYALLALAALITAALVVAALLDHRGFESDIAPRPSGTIDPVAPGPSPTLVATPSAPAVTAAPAAAGPRRLLSAVDGTTAWRGLATECPGTTVVERTDDAGATWQQLDAGADVAASSLLRLEASNADLIYLVALDAASGCSPVYVATYTDGADFTAYPDRTDGVWFRDPLDVRSVHAPGGAVALPCALQAVAPQDDETAAVLCDDGGVVRTSDQGSTWSGPLPVAGAVAIDDTDDGWVIAAVGRDGCAGTQILALAEGEDETTVEGCAPEAAASGNTAISDADGALWLWAGDVVAQSPDGGATW